MKKTFTAMLLAGAGTIQLLAADISGNWRLTITGGSREATLQLALRQQGSSVTGNVTGPRREYPITKGSVDGNNNIEIVLGGDGPLGGARITGTVGGRHMRLTVHTKRGQSDGAAEKVQ